jgi:putative transposase
MANTYTQMHVHIVTAVKYRRSLIDRSFQDRLHDYLGGILRNHGHKPLQINSEPDHLHALIGMSPTQSASDMMRILKGDSSAWLNKTIFDTKQFAWQTGYGLFHLSKDRVPYVASYIHNQEAHHRKICFADEYRQLLTDAGIEFDERYLFHDPI